jgi:hypothetical protein
MFKINWEKLSENKIDERLQKALNEQFQEQQLPDFLAPISVMDLSPGFKPPVLQLLDISSISNDVKEKMYAWFNVCFCIRAQFAPAVAVT